MYLTEFFASSVSRHVALSLSLALSVPVVMAQAQPGTPLTKPVQAAPTSTLAAPAVLARGPAGLTITANDVLAELQRASVAERQSILSQPDAIQQIANNLLVRRALAAEAERDGLLGDPLMVSTLVIARDRALSDARLVRLDAQNNPSDAALDAYARNVYQTSGTRFEKPAQTRARHILLANNGAESLQKAQALLAQLRAGASFEELAKANSTDQGSAARGGDLGFFGAGQMVRPFEDAVNALAKPGDLSAPVESQFGYHIIRLEERREKSRQPYEDVRTQLLSEARTAILNETRTQKVLSLNKDFVYERAAIEALTKPEAR